MKQFMFTKTNKMIKKLLLIICLFVGLNTVAQNQLQFNRVIDTVLSITIPTGLNLNTTVNGTLTSGITYGDFISPTNGKVWKIESIMIQAPFILDESIPYCNTSNGWSSNWASYLRIQSVLRDESIANSLHEVNPTSATSGENFLTSPIWVNNAELGIAFRSTVTVDACLTQPYTGYVFLSIIEFNVE
jgi:hypothetical protein